VLFRSKDLRKRRMSTFINTVGSASSSSKQQSAIRKTTPEQLVRLAQRDLSDLVEAQMHAAPPIMISPPDKADDLCKKLSQLKSILYGLTGDGDKTEVDEERAAEVSRRLQEQGLVLQLVDKLELIPFEARKDTAQIFNNLAHKNVANFVGYISEHFEVVQKIARGYASPDIALSCGSMLRECMRYEDLTRQFLDADSLPLLWLFFDSFVHLPNFDVASDAFNTLRDILVCARHKQVAADFLERHYTEVFARYEVLLESDNYVTRRRSLKLLGELLLDRGNFNVMMRFIASEHNLQVVMNLLRDKSANIQFEAFHVFKVFVANPNKPAKIRLILFKNKQKLCAYLSNFHQEKEDDDSQFSEEKKLLIATLGELERPSSEELRLEMLTAPPESLSSAVTRDQSEDRRLSLRKTQSESDATGKGRSSTIDENALNIDKSDTLSKIDSSRVS